MNVIQIENSKQYSYSNNSVSKHALSTIIPSIYIVIICVNDLEGLDKIKDAGDEIKDAVE